MTSFIIIRSLLIPVHIVLLQLSRSATNMHALTKKVIYINTYYTFLLKHTCFMLAKYEVPLCFRYILIIMFALICLCC